MKRSLIVIIILSAAAFFFSRPVVNSLSGTEADSLRIVLPEKYHAQVNNIITTILSRYHYKKIKFNDSVSSDVFNRYLKTLDYSKTYFLKEDIAEFEKYRYEFDDNLMNSNLDPAFKIFNVFLNRVDERIDYVKDVLLKKEFDYTVDEEFTVNRDESDWAETNKELDEVWRKRIKNDALSLKLAGKDWDSISETLEKRYENFRKIILQYNSEDVFQLVMNSYTEAIDPHSNYLSPVSSENFNISMSRSLEGIGAQLTTEDDYTKVADIIPGGPAYKSGKLHRDDKIIGVAQGDEGEMVDVIGWRITEVVQLIRGPKDSKVRLQILKASEGVNAVPKEISLIRDKVKLEEQSAKKDILELNNNGKPFRLGVIEIPAFYIDFEDQRKGNPNYKSTTRDVRLLLDSLKDENVDGVIIDLRNNGGGSLQEAIQLTGLFITEGPVVQVRNVDGKIDIGNDPDPSQTYSGPLAVLVNRYSASASEIFAGAIQDYGRGIIIGEQTYGKGTVQNLIDLNRLMQSSDNKFGQVKLTIAKYYRIDGGSTQHLGVVPDIAFPSAYDPKEFGESSEPSALEWDEIASAKYNEIDNLNSFIPTLLDKHQKRTLSNAEFEYLKEDIQDYLKAKEKKTVSLNLEKRKLEKEREENEKFERENERRKSQGLKLLEKGEKGTEELKVDDPLLKEAGFILADLISITS